MAVDELSAVFAALADPTRREILTRLSRGDATVGELAEPFQISLPAVSRHLRVLQAVGLITQDRQAQWRRTSMRTAPLREATSWLEQLSRRWDERFDRLDAHLARVKQTRTSIDQKETLSDD